MNPEREMAALADYAGRAAGTDAERRAAVHLRDRLRALGRVAEVEPSEIWPRTVLAHALFALVAVTGSLVSVSNPALGAALVLLAVVMSALELFAALRPSRLLTGRRASQNVSSREQGDKPGVLVVAAHYDAAGEAAGLSRLTRLAGDPWAVLLGSMVLLLFACVARVVGADGVALSAAQLVPTVALVLLMVPLVETELAEPSARSEDNSAAVVTALRLAERFGGRLRHFDLWIVLTGAHRPFAAGMIGWLRRHRRELAGRSTLMIGLHGSGAGGPLFCRRHGSVVPLAADARLLRLCRAMVEDGLEAREVVVRVQVDAAAATARGLPAMTVAGDGGDVDGDSLERAFAFCSELVARIDAELGPDIARG